MKKKMKGVLFVALLAVAGLFGISSGLSNNNLFNQADGATVGSEVYYRDSATSKGGKNYLYTFGSEQFGGWRGKQGGSDDGGYYFDVSGVSGGLNTMIFNGDGAGQTSNITYSASTPFYVGNSSVGPNNLLYAYSSNASLNGSSFTFNKSTYQFSLTTGVLTAGTTVKFYGQNYRSDYQSGNNLTGFNNARDSSGNYVVTKKGSFTFTCTARAYGTYGDFTYGMTSTFTPTVEYTVTKYTVKSDTMATTSIGSETVAGGGLPTTPTLSGYTFYKWYSNASCTTEVTAINSNMTVYALMYKQGYYLVGDSTFTGSASTAWSIEGAVKPTSVGGDNAAAWEGITIPNSSQFKVAYYESTGSFTYQNKDLTGNHLNFSGGGSSNITCSSTGGGTYKVYYTTSLLIAINKDYTLTYYEIKDGSTSSSKTTTGNTDILLSTSLSGKFPSYSGYTIKGYYTDSACTSAVDITTTYPTGAMSIYAKYMVNPATGYHIVGDNAFLTEFGITGNTWDVFYSLKMNDTTGDNKALYSFTTSTTITIKAYYYSPSSEYYVQDTEMSESASEHGVTFDGYGNYVVPAGTYSLYIFTKNDRDHSSLTWGIPLDSYCSEFLSETGDVCDGSSTDKNALLVVMGSLETDWAMLDSTAQTTLRGAVANPSGSDTEQVAARYDYILGKYGYAAGSGNFHDFMSRTPTPRGAIRNFSPFSIINGEDGGDNTTTIIIIIASSASLLSITALSVLLVKKRKNKEQ